MASDKSNMVHKKPRGRPPKDEGSRSTDRRTMVDAAVEILREGGASALSARAVAEHAGTAVGTVYTQFDSLEALRLEANAVTMRLLRVTLADALATVGPASTEERLLRLAVAYIGFAADNHNAWAAIFERRTIDAPPAIAADISALFAVLEEVLRDDGRLRDGEVPTMAKALWSSVHGMVYLGNVGGLGPVGPGDVHPMIDALVRATVRGFGAPKRRASRRTALVPPRG